MGFTFYIPNLLRNSFELFFRLLAYLNLETFTEHNNVYIKDKNGNIIDIMNENKILEDGIIYEDVTNIFNEIEKTKNL